MFVWSLGDSTKGVNLCKHADIQLKAAEGTGQSTCWLLMYKVSPTNQSNVYYYKKPSADTSMTSPEILQRRWGIFKQLWSVNLILVAYFTS